MPSQTDLRAWLRHPVDFELADDAKDSRFVFQPPQGEERATANEAVGALSQGIRTMNADPSARAWATPAILALRLMARGALAEPNANERSQLQEAARGLDRDPARAQAKIRGFLDALAADAPDVAVTPQRSGDGDAPPVAPRMEPTRPRSFVGTLVVQLRDPAEIEAADTDPTVATVSLRVRPQDSGWGAVEAAEVWSRENHHFGAGARQGIRTLMSASATVWPSAARVLADPDLGTATLTEEELGSLATARTTAALAAHRLQIQWPADLEREVTSRAVIQRTDRPRSERAALFSRESVFRLDWRVALGDEELTADEVERLVASSSGLLRLRDQWVFVDPQRLQRLRQQSSQDVSADQALRAAASGELDVDGRTTEVDTLGWLDDVRRRLAGRDHERLVQRQPATLDGQLRDYQLDGLRWMAQLVDLGLGGCLADDMGLGKTIMFIALHLHRASQGETRPTLVVCPASVVGNWVREIERFAPDQPVRRHHGSERTLTDLKTGLVVTTYATMRRDVEDLAEVDWGMVVADEAQNVKNVRSAAARALRELPADAKLALTGTPVENNLAELWAILDWTTPGLLGSSEQFRADWSRRIERHGDTDRAQQLSALIRPFVLRRRKSDPGIAPELPPKIETDYRVGLTREQVGLYEAVVRDTMAEIESAAGMARRGLVIKLLTQLKQICNHPAQFLRQPDAPLARRSAKLEMFDELVDEIRSEDGAALVFTQYARMGQLLERRLTERRIGTQFLYGGTPVRTRETMVQRFQAGEVPVFVLSLKAAGTGLNLTHADHVVHYDRWWNPAVEDQATDRAHRIGQDKVVHVHRLISEGTIEESVAELIASKRSLADAVVNSGEAALTELSDAELADLVRLRHARV